MKKYLFASDLDGTLLNKNHQLSRKTIKYVRKLVKEGHFFVINTGRPYQGMISFKNQLNVDCPFICDNGGAIYWDNHDGFPIYTGIPVNIVKELYQEIKPYIHGALFSSHQKLFFHNKKNVPEFIVHIDQNTIVYENDILENIQSPVILISLFVLDGFQEIINNTLEKYKNYITYRDWGSYSNIKSYEIFSVNSSKGNALIYLKKHLNIPNNYSIAFGDELNDIEMLKKADIGVAMINAKEEVKDQATHLTIKNNHKNGVIHFINAYMKNNIK